LRFPDLLVKVAKLEEEISANSRYISRLLAEVSEMKKDLESKVDRPNRTVTK